MKASELTNKLLPVVVELSTGDKLTVQVKRYGITVVQQAQQVAAANRLQANNISEDEYVKQTCENVISLVAGWDLMLDDTNEYPLDHEHLSQLPAMLLQEIVEKVMESLTFRRQK